MFDVCFDNYSTDLDEVIINPMKYFDVVREPEQFNDSFVTRECELPVITATNENINAIFDINNRMERSVVFVDELLLKQHKMSEKLINQSPHLILSISRDILFIGYAPLESIFTIERDGKSTCAYRFG